MGANWKILFPILSHVNLCHFPIAKMLKEMAVSRNEVAVIGDQLMTDMLGANIMRLFTILTAPNCTKRFVIYEV